MQQSSLLIFFIVLGASCALGISLRRDQDICAKGQSYWCQNITTASKCRAVKHCIQSVWEHEKPIEVDKSEICQTCLDMVKQARDQLLSNQTQEEIKQVLDGTCKLIPIKVIQNECIKLMDQFGPELIDTLASEMDPQVVCSVAGLCDNNRVHQIEADYKKQNNKGKMDCASCNVAVDGMRNKVGNMSPDEFLHILSRMCGKLGSYSDGCFGIALKEHTKALSWIRHKIHSKPFCSLVGLCKIEDNPSVEVIKPEMLSVRVMQKSNGDLPCELCVQLVQHLKDIIVANTTEADFKRVLTGICNQMTSYKDECLNLVDEYYDIIYSFLVTELDGKVLCQEIQICPRGVAKPVEVFRPLVSVDVPVDKVESIQLPVTRYNPITYVPSNFVANGELNEQTLCSMCEFFLHFVQQEITLPSTENKIKLVVERGCSRLPSSVSDQCRTFVDTYMDEFIALLAQEIDPSLVCPMLGVCPRGLVAVSFNDKPNCPLCLLAFQEINSKMRSMNRTAENINGVVDDLCMRDEFPNSLSLECVNFITRHRRAIVDMILTEFTPQESCSFIDLCIPTELAETKPNNPAGDIYTNEIKQNPDVEDSSTCTLCEFVMTKIAALLKDKKTELEIKSAVYHVCYLMPKTVKPKCHQFITQYADAVIELLSQEIDPKEVCTAIELCSTSKVLIEDEHEMKKIDEVEDPNTCVLCELILTKIDSLLKDKKTEEEIKNAVMNVCAIMPKSYTPKCRQFITQYADLVIELLAQEMDPKEVCTAINLCPNAKALMQASMEKCLLCEVLMDSLRTVLTDPDVDHDINKQLDVACARLPLGRLHEACFILVQELAPQIEMALRTLPVGSIVCRRIMVCENRQALDTIVVPSRSACIRGSTYWCLSSAHAAMCNAVGYCQKEVWKSEKPKKAGHLKGRVVISY